MMIRAAMLLSSLVAALPLLAAAPTVSFLFPIPAAIEEAGGVQLTVVRSYGGGGAVTYSTSPETATAGVDYTPVAGTLTWASADPPAKTFTIPITDDQLPEGIETFRVTLGPAAGFAIRPPSSVVIVIAASDMPVPTASEWGLLALAMMLAVAGALVMRR